jgi:hypothetical protein
MQLHTIDRRNDVTPKVNRGNSTDGPRPSKDSSPSQYVLSEINAYISIRDMRVAAAEVAATVENLRQATLANDFVETCLTRPQVVYAAQHLPETSAAFERERCAVVKARIAELRANL